MLLVRYSQRYQRALHTLSVPCRPRLWCLSATIMSSVQYMEFDSRYLPAACISFLFFLFLFKFASPKLSKKIFAKYNDLPEASRIDWDTRYVYLIRKHQDMIDYCYLWCHAHTEYSIFQNGILSYGYFWYLVLQRYMYLLK